jgi:hypothetical protein
MLFAFQGKGSALAFDLGVLARSYPEIPALQQNQVVLTANSGGSILAVYFSCFGITEETIERASHEMKAVDVSAIRGNEQVLAKMRKLLLNEHGELPAATLNAHIAFALGVDYRKGKDDLASIVARADCRPRLPLIIVAANHEVLANRGVEGAMSSRNEKDFNPGNYDVAWKPDAFDYYRSHPDALTRNAPDLRLGDSPRIGKGATYFVDRTMFGVLSRIPPEERLADLRLVETPADLALAILASSAEPTYFDPVPESDPAKLMTGDKLGDLGTSTRRSYCGGFVMPLVAQDARRALPQLRVYGTSSVPLFRSARALLEAWYLVDAQTLFLQNHWWGDFDVSPSETVKRELAAHRLTAAQEYEAGWEAAEASLRAPTALPRLVSLPKHRGAVGHDETPLPTRRGLGPLQAHRPESEQVTHRSGL